MRPAGSVLCMFSETWRLLKVAFAGWWNDRAMSLGASIAFTPFVGFAADYDYQQRTSRLDAHRARGQLTVRF